MASVCNKNLPLGFPENIDELRRRDNYIRKREEFVFGDSVSNVYMKYYEKKTLYMESYKLFFFVTDGFEKIKTAFPNYPQSYHLEMIKYVYGRMKNLVECYIYRTSDSFICWNGPRFMTIFGKNSPHIQLFPQRLCGEMVYIALSNGYDAYVPMLLKAELFMDVLKYDSAIEIIEEILKTKPKHENAMKMLKKVNSRKYQSNVDFRARRFIDGKPPLLPEIEKGESLGVYVEWKPSEKDHQQKHTTLETVSTNQFEGHTSAIVSILYLSDLGVVVSGSRDGRILVHDIHSGNILRTREHHLVAGRMVRDYEVLKFLQRAGENFLLSGCSDGSIECWDMKDDFSRKQSFETGKGLKSICGLISSDTLSDLSELLVGVQGNKFLVLELVGEDITYLGFTEDSKLTSTSEEEEEEEGNRYGCVSLKSKNNHFVVASGVYHPHTIQLIKIERGQNKTMISHIIRDFVGHRKKISHLETFSRGDNEVLVSCGDSNLVLIHSLDKSEPIRHIHAGRSINQCLILQNFLICSQYEEGNDDDTYLKVFNSISGKCLVEAKRNEEEKNKVTIMSWGDKKDGKVRFFTGDWDGKIIVHQVFGLGGWSEDETERISFLISRKFLSDETNNYFGIKCIDNIFDKIFVPKSFICF